MKNLKLALAGLMVVSFAACSSSDPKADNATVVTKTITGTHTNETFTAGILNKKINKGIINIDSNTKNTKEIKIAPNGGTKADYSIAMEAIDAGVVKNEEKIILTGSHKVGMVALNGGEAVNNGTIDLTGAKDSIGMYADGKNSRIINEGTIILPGTRSDSGNMDNFDKTGDHELGKDNHGNIGMKATNHGRIINKGTITFNKK